MCGNKEIGKCPGRRTIVANCVPLSAFESRNFGQQKKNKKASDQSSLSGHVTRWQLFLARIANYDTISNRQQQLQQPQQQHQLQQQQHPAHSSNTKQQRLFAASQPANLWMHLAFGPVCPFFWQPKSKTAYYQRFLCLTAWGQRS